MVFDKNWFRKNQKMVLWTLNTPLIKRLVRKILGIHTTKKINYIEPNNFVFGGHKIEDNILVTRCFYADNKFSKKIYKIFKPIWWILHFWDWLIADRFVRKLSFGFSTLTKVSDAGDPGTTSVDGRVYYTSGADWDTAHNATDGTGKAATVANEKVECDYDGSDYDISRVIMLFDTSSLTGDATISAAKMKLAAIGLGAVNNDTTDLDIVSSNPASNTTLDVADFDQLGTTVFGSIALADWVSTSETYNDITLNGDGLSNISKTGISKFGFRLALDTDDVACTALNRVQFYMSENGGAQSCIEITYTLPAPVGNGSGGSASGGMFMF